MKKSLLLKIFVLLLVCMLIPLVILSGINYRLTYNQLKENLVSKAQQNTEKVAYYFIMELGEFFNFSYYVANDGELQNEIEHYANGEVTLDNLYYEMLKSVNSRSLLARVKYPAEYIFVLNDEAIVTRFNHSNHVKYTDELENIKEKDWYQSLSKELSDSVRVFKDDDYINTNGGEKIYIARNIVTKEGQNTILIISIGQYIMDRLIDNYRPAEDSSIFIVTDKGNCIAQGEQNKLAWEDVASLEKSIFTEHETEQYIRFSQEELLLNVKEFTFSDLPKKNWAVVVLTPTKSIMQSISYIKYTTYITLLFYVVVIVILFILAKRTLFDRIVKVNQAMEQVGIGNMDVTLIPNDDEIGTLYKGFNRMTQSIRESKEQTQKEEKERIALELSMLQSQITPHFVRNTLNVIRWMAEMIRAEGIARAVVSLTKLLDYNIREHPQGVTLKDEFNNIEEYIYIQKLRYGNKFVCEAEIEQQVEQHKTLKLLLQPIVENCILHGFSNITSVGHIWMKAYQKNDTVVIEISDNGSGIPKNQIKKILEPEDSSQCSRIGLYNVNRRIQYHYGAAYGLSLSENDEKGTTVKITLPYNHKLEEWRLE